MSNVSVEELNKIFKSIKSKTTLSDFSNQMGISLLESKGLIELLKVRGYDIDIISDEDEEYIIKKVAVRTNNSIKADINRLNENKLCIVSDTHLCSTVQQLGLLNKIYEEANKRGINTFIHCGDVIDGDYTKKRPDQNYQLFRRGFDEQTDYVIDMYPYIKGSTTYFIEGSHDQTHVKNGGATPGIWIDREREDMVYLGTPEYTLNIDKVKIKMQHPGGGCARSLSYKPQIAIDEMDTNDKPNMFLQGHYHKSYGCLYRNVHAFLVPSLMDQSGFMKMNNLQSICGAYFMNIYSNGKGHIEYLDVERITFDKNDIDENDYKKVKKLVIK